MRFSGPYGFNSGVDQPVSTFQGTTIIWSVQMVSLLLNAVTSSGTVRGVVVYVYVNLDASRGCGSD